jgi:hypothetical protein
LPAEDSSRSRRIHTGIEWPPRRLTKLGSVHWQDEFAGQAEYVRRFARELVSAHPRTASNVI